MKVVAVSDLHENLPVVPECDLLTIAGDISYAFKGDLVAKQKFLVGPFKNWLEGVPAKEIVLVAGNHDQSIERWGFPPDVKLQVPRCHYLQDEGIELLGVKIWGTPWQPYFYDWAFNAPERNGEDFLAAKFSLIPDDTDIVVCHGPPFGYGDQVGNPHVEDRSGQPRVGSQSMTDALQRVQPPLMVCGHIHSGYGRYQLGDTEVVNAALVNNQYEPVNPLIEIDLG